MNNKQKKTNKNNKNLKIDLDSETNSDNLSEELKRIIGDSKNDNSKSESKSKSNLDILNNNQTNQEKPFDITKIYTDIYTCLNRYRFIFIHGEITAFKISDDNAWITIKLPDYQIQGIYWKISKDLKYNMYKVFKIGDQISFKGNFGIMKKNLSIYFNIKSMEKNGKGDYMDIYEQFRLKIKQLGLGQEKKILKTFPYTIGIITALEGAAIQDILQTFKLDNFVGNIIIKNSMVQGTNCPKSIINSIDWFEKNHFESIDLLMITRGGGSYEDLVGFSDWELLNKIASTQFVTLSAVGHQVDNQLSDEVADYKFATPSIGAKYIVEVQQKYKSKLNNVLSLVENIFQSYLRGKDRFEFITNNYSNIIKSYDLKSIIEKTNKYIAIISNISNRYNIAKIRFFDNLSNLKPSIYRNGLELVSINDFVNFNKNKLISPKKIEIKLIDGEISISYKVNEYEQFN